MGEMVYIGEVAFLRCDMDKAVELRSLTLPSANESDWLPDDELTQEWLLHVEQYRSECDAADRAQINDGPSQKAP
jgi:hypothetical protein